MSETDGTMLPPRRQWIAQPATGALTRWNAVLDNISIRPAAMREPGARRLTISSGGVEIFAETLSPDEARFLAGLLGDARGPA